MVSPLQAVEDHRVLRLRGAHILDNRLTDGGEFVSLAHQPATFNPQEGSWYSFLLEAEPTLGL
jgi:hypothetical protein